MSRKIDYRAGVGYFGIGVENGKTIANLGTIWRSAVNLGASFTFQIGDRYKRQCSDTVGAHRKLPHYVFDTVEAWAAATPHDCVRVAVEILEPSCDLVSYQHPQTAVYLLGPEDGSLSKAALVACHERVSINTPHCMNQAVTAGVVMYDRHAKRNRAIAERVAS